jgi:arginine deiminase
MTAFVPYLGPIDALRGPFVLVRHPIFPFPVCARVWRAPLGLRFSVLGVDRRTEIGVPDEWNEADRSALLAAFAHHELLRSVPVPVSLDAAERAPMHLDTRASIVSVGIRFFVEGFDEGDWKVTMPEQARERAVQIATGQTVRR